MSVRFAQACLVVFLAGCGGTVSPDAGTPPVCGADGAACALGSSKGLCRGDTCTACNDVTDDAACRAVYGARSYCVSGACTEIACRVDADCAPGSRCTAANTCEAVTCTATAPTNGRVSGRASATVGSGSTAAYTCNVGFTLTGTAPRCESTGQLAGAEPTCTLVTCQAAAPANGTVNGGTTTVSIPYNTSATWACDTGYRRVGTPPTCRASGALSASIPTCEPVSCLVTPPSNGTVNGSAAAVVIAFNATPTFACNAGYALQGSSPSCGGTGMLTGPAPTCRLAACNDTVDGDGDGFAGFPSDPGCASTADDDETDDCPSGPGCPTCSNDLDDDGDSLADFPDDPGCLSASGASELGVCTSMDPVTPLSASPRVEAFAGTADDVDLSCGANGRDVVMRLFVTAPLSTLRVDTLGSPGSVALAVRASTCGGADLACGLDNLDGGSAVTLSAVQPGEYFVLADDLGANTASVTVNVSGEFNPGGRCGASALPLRCPDGYACRGAVGTCAVAACNDAIDADGDGFAGYPTDPGCASLSDDDETDQCPSGPGCPACANALDDDGDGAADYPADPGCAAASGPSELSACASIDGVQPYVSGQAQTFVGAANDVAPGCGTDGRDRVYRLVVRLPLASLSADTVGSATPASVSFRGGTCSGAELVCAVGNQGSNARADLTAVAPGEYFVVVDDLGASSTGDFALRVSGEYAAGARCNADFACAAGTACVGAAGAETCVVTACSDGIDADGDGFNAYPMDPGCESPADTDETDNCPSGPGCPACANDLDDDGDSQLDYPADLACTSASDTSEN